MLIVLQNYFATRYKMGRLLLKDLDQGCEYKASGEDRTHYLELIGLQDKLVNT